MISYDRRRNEIKIDVDHILDQIDLGDVIAFYGTEIILDYIGPSDCKEHFELIERDF